MVSIIGTADQFTIQDWYLGRQEQFRTAMADTLLESQVQNLADAMGVIRAAGAGTDYFAARICEPAAFRDCGQLAVVGL